MAQREENIQIVRCNQCMDIFPEREIVYDGDEDTEYCPECGESGCLMDMGIYGKEDDKVLFPHLSHSKQWDWLKKEFEDVNTLCYFENEIRGFEEGYGNEPPEDYPLIVQWWEGLVDNKELAEHYQKL